MARSQTGHRSGDAVPAQPSGTPVRGLEERPRDDARTAGGRFRRDGRWDVAALRREAVRQAPGVALILCGAVGFAVVYDALRDSEDLWSLDDPVLEWMVAHRTAWLVATLTFVTNVFGPVVLPILVAAGALAWGVVTRRWWPPVALVGSIVIAVGVTSAVKWLVARPRPPDEAMTVAGVESSFSFPSGHTAAAATFILVLGYLLWISHRSVRGFVGLGVVSVVIIVLVGGSRLYLGYHFVTDVIAGLCVAVAVLGAVVCVDLVVDRGHAGGRRVGAESGT